MNWEQTVQELQTINKEFSNFHTSVEGKKRKDWNKEDENTWEILYKKCIATHYERIRINMERIK